MYGTDCGGMYCCCPNPPWSIFDDGVAGYVNGEYCEGAEKGGGMTCCSGSKALERYNPASVSKRVVSFPWFFPATGPVSFPPLLPCTNRVCPAKIVSSSSLSSCLMLQSSPPVLSPPRGDGSLCAKARACRAFSLSFWRMC